MKGIALILISQIILVARCQGNSTSLIGTTWVNEIAEHNCNDSLKFESDSTVIWYSCEIAWHFDARYSRRNDTITILIVDAQFEVDNTDGLEPTSKWILLIKNTELEHEYIGHKDSSGFKEVSKETYGMISNYKKVK